MTARVGPTGTLDRPGTLAASVAAVLGVVFAAMSAYWALGGTWLLDTVGGALEARGRAGDASLRLLVWATVVLKLAAALLGLAAVRRWFDGLTGRLSTIGAWTAAVILTAYGAVLTGAGLLVVSGVIPANADADMWAIRWHAFLWDPWFLVWGVVLTIALIQAGRARTRR